MPIFKVTYERKVERAFEVTQEASLFVEASDPDEAHEAVAMLANDGDHFDLISRWHDSEDRPPIQITEDDDAANTREFRVSEYVQHVEPFGGVVRAAEVLHDA